MIVPTGISILMDEVIVISAGVGVLPRISPIKEQSTDVLYKDSFAAVTEYVCDEWFAAWIRLIDFRRMGDCVS